MVPKRAKVTKVKYFVFASGPKDILHAVSSAREFHQHCIRVAAFMWSLERCRFEKTLRWNLKSISSRYVGRCRDRDTENHSYLPTTKVRSKGSECWTDLPLEQ